MGRQTGENDVGYLSKVPVGGEESKGVGAVKDRIGFFVHALGGEEDLESFADLTWVRRIIVDDVCGRERETVLKNLEADFGREAEEGEWTFGLPFTDASWRFGDGRRRVDERIGVAFFHRDRVVACRARRGEKAVIG